MDISFEYYKIFYYAAKYGNITKAAAALGSNQPNVTRILKLLEAQLNCRLFFRQPRGISLTEEGERLYACIEEACKCLLNVPEEMNGQMIEGGGTIEIGATETALHLFLLNAVREFKQNYSKIRIKVHNHTTPEIVKQLSAGKLDFAVITDPFPIPGGFCCENVYEFFEILVGGMQYGHLCREQMELDALCGYPWVGLGKGTATYDFYRDFFRKQNAAMELDMEVATSDLLLPLIRNHLGIGFVPEKLASPFISAGTLVQIPLACSIPPRKIQIVSDKGRAKSLAAELFYKYLKKA